MMELKEPDRKQQVPPSLQEPFPIPIGPASMASAGQWQLYLGRYIGDCVIVEDPYDMAALSSKGFFGKGSFSRDAPKLQGDSAMMPTIIRQRQWKQRCKWDEKQQMLTEEKKHNTVERTLAKMLPSNNETKGMKPSSDEKKYDIIYLDSDGEELGTFSDEIKHDRETRTPRTENDSQVAKDPNHEKSSQLKFAQASNASQSEQIESRKEADVESLSSEDCCIILSDSEEKASENSDIVMEEENVVSDAVDKAECRSTQKRNGGMVSEAAVPRDKRRKIAEKDEYIADKPGTGAEKSPAFGEEEIILMDMEDSSKVSGGTESEEASNVKGVENCRNTDEINTEVNVGKQVCQDDIIGNTGVEGNIEEIASKELRHTSDQSSAEKQPIHQTNAEEIAFLEISKEPAENDTTEKQVDETKVEENDCKELSKASDQREVTEKLAKERKMEEDVCKELDQASDAVELTDHSKSEDSTSNEFSQVSATQRLADQIPKGPINTEEPLEAANNKLNKPQVSIEETVAGSTSERAPDVPEEVKGSSSKATTSISVGSDTAAEESLGCSSYSRTGDSSAENGEQMDTENSDSRKTTEKSIMKAHKNVNMFGKVNKDEDNMVLLLSDDDSDSEEYMKNLKPRLENERFPVRESLHLMLEEAFFLSFGLGCLQVMDMCNKLLSLTEMWQLFTKSDASFISKYVAYHYFRSKGWVVKAGIKFGGDFLLYKKGPSFYHSSYIVIVQTLDGSSWIPDDKITESLTWTKLHGLVRLAESSGKEVMLCQVVRPSGATPESMESPSVISKFKVHEELVRRWVPSEEQEEDGSM